jgi:hypothetical protein
MIKWPRQARDALAFLFRPLQDIDVYVEDVRDEVFYSELFRRIAPKNVRIARVFPVGNRLSVIERARAHDFGSRNALFVIDGDFEWVRGEPMPAARGLYRLDAYCIENLLIQEAAAVQVVVEDAAIKEEEARAKLRFQDWLGEISNPLIGLFVSFAALNSVNPDEPTVAIGIGKIITPTRAGKLPKLDSEKLSRLHDKIDHIADDVAGTERAAEIRAAIRARADMLEIPVDVVSGKDFLLPLFEYRLWSCIPTKTRRSALRIRLARHCKVTRFTELIRALDEGSRGFRAN